MTSAVTEHRSWSVTCRAALAIECWDTGTIVAEDGGVTSRSAAEAALRERGWKLHTDGATCPVCRQLYTGETSLRIRGSVTYTGDPNELSGDEALDLLADLTGIERDMFTVNVVAERDTDAERLAASLAIFTEDADFTPEDDS